MMNLDRFDLRKRRERWTVQRSFLQIQCFRRQAKVVFANRQKPTAEVLCL
jgi:hypothetical protein